MSGGPALEMLLRARKVDFERLEVAPLREHVMVRIVGIMRVTRKGGAHVLSGTALDSVLASCGDAIGKVRGYWLELSLSRDGALLNVVVECERR